MESNEISRFTNNDNVSQPLSLKYIKILRIFLLSVGAWLDEEFGGKTPLIGFIQRKTLALQTLCVFVGSIFFVIFNIANMDVFVFGHILVTQFLGIVIMVVVVTVKTHNHLHDTQKCDDGDPYRYFLCQGTLTVIVERSRRQNRCARVRKNIFYEEYLITVTYKSARSVMTNLKDYGACIREFINFHLFSYKDKGEHYDKVYRLTDKVSYYFTLFQLSVMVVGALLFNLTPLYADYKMGAFENPRPENQSFDFALFLAFPGFRQDEHFIISLLWNAYISLMCGTLICAIDLLLSLMVFQIIAHIKVLMLNIETMKKPKAVVNVTTLFRKKNNFFKEIKTDVQLYDDEENNAVHLLLIEMINHHRLIMSFADRISSFFGPVLALNYLFHLVSGCILLLECTRGGRDDLMRFGPLTCIIFGQLVEISVVFEVVGYMSEKLIDSVYCMPWECMNIRNQRTMHFMLNNVQTPIQLTAMGIVSVGVQTMLQIIKTTFTYYTMLDSISE